MELNFVIYSHIFHFLIDFYSHFEGTLFKPLMTNLKLLSVDEIICVCKPSAFQGQDLLKNHMLLCVLEDVIVKVFTCQLP